MTITENERRALQGILDSDYMDGETGPPLGKRVWTWSANPFSSKKTFSGVVSSLVKKGFVISDDRYADEPCIAITAAGMAALQGSNVPMLSAPCPRSARHHGPQADRQDCDDRGRARCAASASNTVSLRRQVTKPAGPDTPRWCGRWRGHGRASRSRGRARPLKRAKPPGKAKRPPRELPVAMPPSVGRQYALRDFKPKKS